MKSKSYYIKNYFLGLYEEREAKNEKTFAILVCVTLLFVIQLEDIAFIFDGNLFKKES